jgi:flagellar biosynthesis/type III secretory pathway protein FliH
MEITRALVRAEVRAQRHDVEKIVRETLAAAATERGPCVVHLNPDDLARLEGVRFRAGTRLEADSGVRRGDVHVESALGLLVREIDALLASVGERIAGDLA